MHEDNRLIAYILVGLPGSGKSTLRSRLREQYEVPGNKGSLIEISSDDYIESYAESCGKTYNEVFKEAVGPAQKHMEYLLATAIATERNIVWDQTNLTKNKRKQILNKIPHEYKKVCLYVGTDLAECLLRNSQRERSIPEHVIVSMHKGMEIPADDEGFDVVTHCIE